MGKNGGTGKRGRRLFFVFIISLLFLCAGTSIGSINIPAADILKIIISKLPLAALQKKLLPGLDPKLITVVWTIRLPRTILAFLVGGAVSVSGAVIQSVLKNPLASPYTLGVSSGAALGAALIMLAGITLPVISLFLLPLTGFIFSLAAVFAVVAFSGRVDKNFSDNTVVLFGMVVSLFVNALLMTLLALFRDELKNLIIWQMGSFALRGWLYVELLLPFLIVGLIGTLRLCAEMDILTFGDEHALSCGVEVRKVKRELFLFSSVLTGASVALSGTIGFVDLIAPHIARRFVGSAHIFMLPFSFFTGGVICVAADLIARGIVAPSELPVGAVTALVGAPFFLWVYFSKKAR